VSARGVDPERVGVDELEALVVSVYSLVEIDDISMWGDSTEARKIAGLYTARAWRAGEK